MKLDDLAPLMSLGDQASDVGFRQGTVLEWDEQTGTNMVDVGGVQLSDLPALNIGDFVHLAEGDVVGLLRFKSTYFILGRVILPSAVDSARRTFAFDNEANQENNFALTTTPTNRATTIVTVPDWADHALVTVGVNCQAVKPAGTDYFAIRPEVHGSTGQGIYYGNALGVDSFVSGSVTGAFTFTDLVGVTELACHGQINTFLGGWPANASTGLGCHASAVFVRID